MDPKYIQNALNQNNAHQIEQTFTMNTGKYMEFLEQHNS